MTIAGDSAEGLTSVVVPEAQAMATTSRGGGRPRFGLRIKVFLFASIAFVLSGAVFGWTFSRRLEITLRKEFEKRGETLARGLAANSWLDMWTGDKARLMRLVAGALEEPDVIAAAFYRPSGEVDARAAKPPRAGERVLSFRAPIRLRTDPEGSPAAGGGRDREPFELLDPAEGPKPTEVLGTVEIVFSLAAVEKQIADVQGTTLQITALIVAAGLGLVLLLSRVLVTPIERIAATARRIAAGDRGSRAPVASRDEIGELAEAFNTMTERLAEREEELRRMNLGLEQKVHERTAELEVKQHELLAANVELERASRLKSEFLANMSHELRTPLNAVNGFSELLLEETSGPLAPKQRRYVENVLASGRHLLQLINDILDLSKIEAGRMDVRAEEFSIRQVIESAVSVIQPLAQRKGLAVEVVIAPDVDRVELDSGKTKQILYNLMSNAVKFTDRGNVKVSATRENRDRIEVVVADTGIGIKPEDQKRIFREFEQADGSRSRKYEGTGLGLALTRKLVELQGGTVRVESELGKGSRFVVDLPISAARPSPVRPRV